MKRLGTSLFTLLARQQSLGQLGPLGQIILAELAEQRLQQIAVVAA